MKSGEVLLGMIERGYRAHSEHDNPCDFCGEPIDELHWFLGEAEHGDFCSDDCASNEMASRGDFLLDQAREREERMK